MRSPIKIGTRGSPLALYQAELVRVRLRSLYPMYSFEIVKIHTKGDMIRRGSAGSIGERIFTHEIEQALLRNEIDFGVHSAKDLSTELPEGLELSAVLEREDARDCLVASKKKKLSEFPQGAKIGTSSLRRKAQIMKLRSDLEIVDFRGNIETRIKKVEEGFCDGAVLAYAALKRIGLTNFVSEVFDENIFLPQASQGAIAVESRLEDLEVKEMTFSLNHVPSYLRVLAERSFLGRLQGGCQVPVGVWAKIENESVSIYGAIFSLDGKQEIRSKRSGKLDEVELLGKQLAEELLSSGGKEILEQIREKK